jgi:hypothetical protein
VGGSPSLFEGFVLMGNWFLSSRKYPALWICMIRIMLKRLAKAA